MSFKHLSLEEREKMYLWVNLGLSYREIGRRLGRAHTTIKREFKKSARYGQYMPCHAHNRAMKRVIKQRTKAPLKNVEIYLYVREHLRPPHF